MAKKVLKLIVAMLSLLVLWVLILGLLVSNQAQSTTTAIIAGIVMCGLLFIYTYNMLHCYVVEVYMKYKENKSVEE